MSDKKTEWINDYLTGFISSPMFQLPLLTFIEEKCLIFEPTSEAITEDHETIHFEYKALISKLLDGFRQDAKVSFEEIIDAITSMNKKKDLRNLYQAVFEQVLATESMELFQRMMTAKNIELQQQALLLIMQTVGDLPDVLQQGGKAAEVAMNDEEDAEEARILAMVLQRSKEDYEEQRERNRRIDEDYEKAVMMSKMEARKLEVQKQEEQEKMEQAFSRMKFEGPGARSSRHMSDFEGEAGRTVLGVTTGAAAARSGAVPPPASYQPRRTRAAREPSPPSRPSPQRASEASRPRQEPLPSMGASGSGRSTQEAASDWLSSALSDAQRQVAPSGAPRQDDNAAQFARRQAFLKEQRDLLVARKKEAREQQLRDYERKSRVDRPSSSRNARSAMGDGGVPVTAEDERRLAMRRALAAKLKDEVIGKSTDDPFY